jgi:hypothetical protein
MYVAGQRQGWCPRSLYWSRGWSCPLPLSFHRCRVSFHRCLHGAHRYFTCVVCVLSLCRCRWGIGRRHIEFDGSFHRCHRNPSLMAFRTGTPLLFRVLSLKDHLVVAVCARARVGFCQLEYWVCCRILFGYRVRVRPISFGQVPHGLGSLACLLREFLPHRLPQLDGTRSCIGVNCIVHFVNGRICVLVSLFFVVEV